MYVGKYKNVYMFSYERLRSINISDKVLQYRRCASIFTLCLFNCLRDNLKCLFRFWRDLMLNYISVLILSSPWIYCFHYFDIIPRHEYTTTISNIDMVKRNQPNGCLQHWPYAQFCISDKVLQYRRGANIFTQCLNKCRTFINWNKFVLQQT